MSELKIIKENEISTQRHKQLHYQIFVEKDQIYLKISKSTGGTVCKKPILFKEIKLLLEDNSARTFTSTLFKKLLTRGNNNNKSFVASVLRDLELIKKVGRKYNVADDLSSKVEAILSAK